MPGLPHVLGMEPKSSQFDGKHFTDQAISPALPSTIFSILNFKKSGAKVHSAFG